MILGSSDFTGNFIIVDGVSAPLFSIASSADLMSLSADKAADQTERLGRKVLTLANILPIGAGNLVLLARAMGMAKAEASKLNQELARTIALLAGVSAASQASVLALRGSVKPALTSGKSRAALYAGLTPKLLSPAGAKTGRITEVYDYVRSGDRMKKAVVGWAEIVPMERFQGFSKTVGKPQFTSKGHLVPPAIRGLRWDEIAKLAGATDERIRGIRESIELGQFTEAQVLDKWRNDWIALSRSVSRAPLIKTEPIPRRNVREIMASAFTPQYIKDYLEEATEGLYEEHPGKAVQDLVKQIQAKWGQIPRKELPEPLQRRTKGLSRAEMEVLAGITPKKKAELMDQVARTGKPYDAFLIEEYARQRMMGLGAFKPKRTTLFPGQGGRPDLPAIYPVPERQRELLEKMNSRQLKLLLNIKKDLWGDEEQRVKFLKGESYRRLRKGIPLRWEKVQTLYPEVFRRVSTQLEEELAGALKQTKPPRVRPTGLTILPSGRKPILLPERRILALPPPHLSELKRGEKAIKLPKPEPLYTTQIIYLDRKIVQLKPLLYPGAPPALPPAFSEQAVLVKRKIIPLPAMSALPPRYQLQAPKVKETSYGWPLLEQAKWDYAEILRHALAGEIERRLSDRTKALPMPEEFILRGYRPPPGGRRGGTPGLVPLYPSLPVDLESLKRWESFAKFTPIPKDPFEPLKIKLASLNTQFSPFSLRTKLVTETLGDLGMSFQEASEGAMLVERRLGDVGNTAVNSARYSRAFSETLRHMGASATTTAFAESLLARNMRVLDPALQKAAFRTGLLSSALSILDERHRRAGSSAFTFSRVIGALALNEPLAFMLLMLGVMPPLIGGFAALAVAVTGLAGAFLLLGFGGAMAWADQLKTGAKRLKTAKEEAANTSYSIQGLTTDIGSLALVMNEFKKAISPVFREFGKPMVPFMKSLPTLFADNFRLVLKSISPFMSQIQSDVRTAVNWMGMLVSGYLSHAMRLLQDRRMRNAFKYFMEKFPEYVGKGLKFVEEAFAENKTSVKDFIKSIITLLPTFMTAATQFFTVITPMLSKLSEIAKGFFNSIGGGDSKKGAQTAGTILAYAAAFLFLGKMLKWVIGLTADFFMILARGNKFLEVLRSGKGIGEALSAAKNLKFADLGIAAESTVGAETAISKTAAKGVITSGGTILAAFTLADLFSEGAGSFVDNRRFQTYKQMHPETALTEEQYLKAVQDYRKIALENFRNQSDFIKAWNKAYPTINPDDLIASQLYPFEAPASLNKTAATTPAVTPFMTPQALASVGAVNVSGTVTTVIDGDTIELNGRTVRLSGINAPELTFGKKEAGALEAKQYLESLILGKQVMLDVDDLSQTDKYNRTLAKVYLEGMDVNREMLTQGYAKPMYIKPPEFPPYSVNITVSVDDSGNLLAVTNKSALNNATSHINTWRNQ